MFSSNTRATRSRFSSPQIPPNGSAGGGPLETSRNSANEGSRLLMQRWLEPTVQNKASFEEAGLIRYGVTENMAPLGTLPKPTVAPKKPAPSSVEIPPTQTPIRKIILKPSQSGAAKGVLATTTKEPQSPTLPVEKTTRRALPTSRELDNDDDDYDPKASNGRASAGRTALPRKGHQARASISSRRRSSTTTLRPPMSPAALTPQGSTDAGRRPSDGKDRAERNDKIVKDAVEEAVRHHRYPTAWALRTLYDDNCEDPRFLSMLEDVYTQTADSETREEFSKMLEERKREGKKDNKGCSYFGPPEDEKDRITPHKAKPAPYGSLLMAARRNSITAEDYEELPRASKKIKTRHSDHHTTPKHSHSHRKANGINGHTPVTPSRSRRSRRMADDSDSELSPAISMSSPDDSYDSGDSEGDEMDYHGDLDHHQEAGGSRGLGSLVGASEAARGGGGAGGGGGQDSAGARGPMGGSLASARSSNSDRSQPASPAPTSPTHPHPLPTAASPAADASHNKDPHNSHRHHNLNINHASHSRRASMPGVVDPEPVFTNLTLKQAKGGAAKGSSQPKTARALQAPELAPPEGAAVGQDEEPEKAVDPRMEAKLAVQRRTTQSISNVRATAMSRKGAAAVDDDDGTEEYVPASKQRRGARGSSSMGTGAGVGSATGTRVTRSSNKRTHDEMDDAVSPTALSFPRPPSVSKTPSRAATPVDQPQAKRQRRGPKTKTSPVKKNGVAGLLGSRTGGDAGASIGNDAQNDADHHDDYCSSCGQDGDLVCCDNCDRSFHFECVDLDPTGPLPDEWYCAICASQRPSSRRGENTGVFATVLNVLERNIPRQFALPTQLRNYFDGVKTGPEGLYEDVQPPPSKPSRRKNGQEEAYDFYKLRDADGNVVLCHKCQQSAENKALLTCSQCSLHWHLDCIDPPLTIPNQPPRVWLCPAHVNDLLVQLPDGLAPAHKHRTIKGAQVVKPAFSRGMKNNGYIEVEYDAEDDQNDEEDESGWRTVSQFGRIMKLPEKGIILDFIEQLRAQGAGYIRPNRVRKSRHSSKRSSKVMAGILVDSAIESEPNRQAIMTSLFKGVVDGSGEASLGQANMVSALDQLADAVAKNADPAVYKAIADGSAQNFATGNLTEADKQSLHALQAQLDAMSRRIQTVLHVAASASPKSAQAEAPHVEALLEEERSELGLDAPVQSPVQNASFTPPNVKMEESQSPAGEQSIAGQPTASNPSTNDEDILMRNAPEEAEAQSEESNGIHEAASDIAQDQNPNEPHEKGACESPNIEGLSILADAVIVVSDEITKEDKNNDNKNGGNVDEAKGAESANLEAAMLEDGDAQTSVVSDDASPAMAIEKTPAVNTSEDENQQPVIVLE